MNKNFLVKLLSGTVALTTMLNLAPSAMAMFPPDGSTSNLFSSPPLFQNDQVGTPANNNFNPGIHFEPPRTGADNSNLNFQEIIDEWVAEFDIPSHFKEPSNNIPAKEINTNLNIQPTSPTNQNHQQPNQEVEEEIVFGNNFSNEDDEEFNNEFPEDDGDPLWRNLNVSPKGGRKPLVINKAISTPRGEQMRQELAFILYGDRKKKVGKDFLYNLTERARKEVNKNFWFLQYLLNNFGLTQAHVNLIENPSRTVKRSAAKFLDYLADNRAIWIALFKTLKHFDMI